MNEPVHILGQNKKTICRICGKFSHPFTTKCNYNDLVSRIDNLLNANSAIPHILEANVEATDLANTFRVLAQDTSRALGLCEEVILEFDNGPIIWARFKERLEKKWPKTSALATEENQKASSPKSTTPSETESNRCIEGTPPGETTAPDSSQSTPSAMPVEKEQRL